MEEEVILRIGILKKKVEKNKNYATFVNLIAVTLGALITLTLGIEMTGYESGQKNIALLFAALLTVVNGWSLLFDYRKLWVRQKKTLFGLYRIKNEIGFMKSAGNIVDDEIDNLFIEYKQVWDDDNSNWTKIIGRKTDNQKKD
jgi:hypothetical protein